MTLPARDNPRGRPRLTIVRGTHASRSHPVGDWRRLARALMACTHELGEFLAEQRWGRVHEVLCERRELLTFLQRMELDVEGRRCLMSIEQAIAESEAAVDTMCRRAGSPATRQA